MSKDTIKGMVCVLTSISEAVLNEIEIEVAEYGEEYWSKLRLQRLCQCMRKRVQSKMHLIHV